MDLILNPAHLVKTVSVFFFSFLEGLTGMYTSVLAVYFS